MSVSLDGYIEGPDGRLDWHLVDDELHYHFNRHLGAMSAFLNGRVMHELMAAYWPTADQDPNVPGPVAQFARIWREMPKFVYSRTLRNADWNTTVVREVVPEEVLRLKALPGGDMALGGADIAAAFQRHGLVDEYRIYVQPVVLGGGKPLFRQGTARTGLRLVESRTFGNGVQLLRYQVPE
ncbi:dihydrofolate reductase family protein [Actinocrinis puniceicyclus]|uniref:Dihydrofolate reductase family protein n=2 Tax=Actinocrinis puniceicyclus TaxID=977794 RepID=A0A8J7WQH8_9ACTN|nr:dihydrofolate reductase family protein [Actinocrinis puniceicyclus]